MVKVNEEAELAVKLAWLCKLGNGKLGHGSESTAVRIMPTSDLICNTDYAYPFSVAEDAAKFKSMARSVHRLDEAACNRELTQREDDRRANLLQAIYTLAAQYGIQRVDHNTDPRGYAVYLHFPDGRGNSWGGDERGWGI